MDENSSKCSTDCIIDKKSEQLGHMDSMIPFMEVTILLLHTVLSFKLRYLSFPGIRNSGTTPIVKIFGKSHESGSCYKPIS